MTFETETVLDRRRLRRRLSLWRALAVIAALLAFGLVVFASAEGAGLAERRQIARVSIEGFISENRDQLKLLKRLADNKQVVAVILFINSPGGTMQFQRARQGAGLERVVQRAEDRADAGEAAFSKLPALRANVGPRPELSRALDAAIAGRLQDRAIHHRLGLLRMGAAHHRLEPRSVRRRRHPGSKLSPCPRKAACTSSRSTARARTRPPPRARRWRSRSRT